MSKLLKKITVLMMAVAVCIVTLQISPMSVSAAATSITGNNSRETAYNYGAWSSINSNYETISLKAGNNESWLAFRVGAGEKIYLGVSYSDEYSGEWLEVCDRFGGQIKKGLSSDAVNSTSVTKSIYLDCDNNSSSAQTYYLILHRGSVDPKKNIYFSVSADNRIRTASTTLSFSASASNPGNRSMSIAGVDSSVITLDLKNNTNIPKSAVVTSVSTSGSQSPNQGGVRHMLMPNDEGVWYISRYNSASSGGYDITANDNISLRQRWSFKYNAQATARSTMRNVKLQVDFQYDLHDTGYKLKLFVR